MTLLQLIVDFLFPNTPQLIALENLGAGEVLEILPPSDLNENGVLALFNYQDCRVKEMVWEIKYKGNRTLSAKLGSILYDTIIDELSERNISPHIDNPVLLPIPVSDRRRLERGFNQAELLAKEIKALDTLNHFQYLPRKLTKISHTESQTKTASRKERLDNLKNSMLVQDRASIEGKLVILVDDVTTTGATFKEAKRALTEAGAKKILCFAVAH